MLSHNRIHKRSTVEGGEHADRLEGEPDVEWVEQQRERRRVKRDFRELMMEEEEDEDDVEEEMEDRYAVKDVSNIVEFAEIAFQKLDIC